MKDLFGISGMMDDYEKRKVLRYEDKNIDLIIDTCRVTDSDKDYETGIVHPAYNSGDWIIVELYDTIEQAKKGHQKWVVEMTAKQLPKQLKDISSSKIAKMCDLFLNKKNWRNRKKKEEK